MRNPLAGALLGCLLWGCGPATLTPAARTALESRITLAHVAVESDRTVAAIVAGGQLFCAADGYVFAVLAADAAPSSVTGQKREVVARSCDAVSPAAMPVPAPADPALVPTIEPHVPLLPAAPRPGGANH